MTMPLRDEPWRARSWRRGLVVLGVVLVMHFVAITGVRRELALEGLDKPTQTTLSIALLKAPPPPAVPPPPAPEPRTAPRKPAASTPAITVAPPAPEPAPAPVPAPPPEPTVEPAVEPVPAVAEPSEPTGLPPAVRQLPTKGRIAYRTTYTRMRGIEAMTYVDWSIDVEGARYELWLRTVDPTGLLDLRSSGEIRPFGIAPFRYIERIEIANRELSVEFDWPNHVVRFAGRGAGEPAPFDDGTQDPLSLQFHLPLLAQTYPWRFTPGSLVHFQVARRKVESYTFAVDGFEPILIQGRVVQTLKVLRPKSPESNRGVELWMAPEFDWIPVRLRFVDTNDEVWDSVLAHLPGAEPPAAPIQQEVVKP
jgi:Protein of unknown function (DUF3108)